MIVAFSTSSAWASVALLEESGEPIAGDIRESHQRASGACLDMLARLLSDTGRSLSEATVFAADLGPGSFTGVRVGVTLAKTLAWNHGALTTGASAFDLIDPLAVVVFPSKRGEYFVRVPGEEAIRTTSLPEPPFVGFGYGGEEVPPDAIRFGRLLAALPRWEPLRLNPEYLIEPSISLPKRPFPGVARG